MTSVFNHTHEEETSDSLSSELPSLSSLSNEGNTNLCTADSFENESISSQSKKIRKKRCAYQKIDDDLRLQLLEAVQKNGETLKCAAKRLDINYSSAKSILHTFRKEGRILKKSALDRTVNLCQFPLGELDPNSMGSFAQFPANTPADRQFYTLESAQGPIYYQGQVQYPTQPENRMGNQMQTFSSNFSQILFGHNVDDNQNCNAQMTIPKLNFQEPCANFGSSMPFEESLASQQQDIPLQSEANPTTPSPLNFLKHVESFYMNYNNSPLSGGNGNIFKEYDSSKNRVCQKEFDSFSELVNAFQNQPKGLGLRRNDSQVSSDGRFFKEEPIEKNVGFDSASMETYKSLMDAQAVLCDALKQASLINNLVKLQMTTENPSQMI